MLKSPAPKQENLYLWKHPGSSPLKHVPEFTLNILTLKTLNHLLIIYPKKLEKIVYHGFRIVTKFFLFFLAFYFYRFCVVIRFFHPRHNGQ